MMIWYYYLTRKSTIKSVLKVRNLQKDVNKMVREREEAVKEEARRAFKP